MPKKLILTICVLGVITAMCFLLLNKEPVCPICGKNHIVHSCKESVGLNEGIVTYNDLLNAYGDPVDIDISHRSTDSQMYVYYDNLTFRLEVDSPSEEDCSADDWKLNMIKTEDPSHMFGEQLHVGCTKKQILQIFRNALKIKESVQGEGYWDHAELWTVYFEYDANNCVSSITFYFYPPY